MKRLLSLMTALAMLLSVTAALAESPAAEAPAAEAAAAVEATEAPAAETVEAPAAEAAETPAQAAPVDLVTVNGKVINDQNAHMRAFMEYYQNMYAMYGMDWSDPQMQLMLRHAALEYAISTEIMFSKAAELGFDQFTDEELAGFEKDARDYIEEYIQSMIGQTVAEDASEEEKTNARAAVLADMQAQGYNEETYIADSVSNAKEQAVYDRLFNEFTKDVQVTDEEITAYFNDLVKEDMERAAADPAGYVSAYENFLPYLDYPEYLGYVTDTAYYVPEGYRAVNHILLKPETELLEKWKGLVATMEEQKQAAEEPEEQTEGADAEATVAPEASEEPVTQEMVDAAEKEIWDSLQPKIDEIQKKLADGANFNDLIAEYGQDPGMSSEEARAKGYNVHANSVIWDPAFRAAAMSLKQVGDVSEPVLGSAGIHLVHYIGDVPAGAIEMTAELKDMFKETLLTERQEEAFSKAEEEWRNGAQIEYTEEGRKLEEEAHAASEAMSEAAEAAPVEEPAEEIPAEGAPAEEAAAAEAPAAETPAEGAATETAPAAETSATEAPAN